MTRQTRNEEQLRAENEDLRARLEEEEDTLRAIHTGEDALIVKMADRPQVIALQGLDAESNRFCGEILAQVSDALIAVDADQRVTYLNAAAERQYRVSASGVIGHQLSEIFTRRGPSTETEAAMWSALREHGRWRGEICHLTHYGREIAVETSVTALRAASGAQSGYVATIRDVTERQEAEEKLRQSNERMQLATEATEVGIWEWNVYANTVRWDAQMFRLYGIPPTVDGCVSYSDWSAAVVPEDLPENERSLQDTVRRCGRSRREFRIQRRDDGEVRYIAAVDAVRVNGRGEAEWVVGTNLDITESKLAAEKVAIAKEAAEKANAAKDQFLAVLSHELRTPLMPVLMAVGMLQRDPELSAEVQDDLAMIKRNIQMETKLIDDLLDLNRITCGKLPLDIEAIDLNQAIRNAYEICSASVRERGIRLKMELSADTGLVGADAARLQQVLWNVLNNAIKFTSVNGLICVSSKRLDGARCEVRVADSGTGISPDVLPHIFDAFEQGGTSVTRQFGGLGLGLAICKGLVALHHGSIRAESSGAGTGATFIVELPSAAHENDEELGLEPIEE